MSACSDIWNNWPTLFRNMKKCMIAGWMEGYCRCIDGYISSFILSLLTGGVGQAGEEGLEAGGQPLHALVQVGQSLQVTDVAQDLVLRDQLVSEVARQHLGLLGERRPG